MEKAISSTSSACSNNRGFTLVELAIVLVIIGLIIGGVLVGQDLIKAGKIRAMTSDIEKYNAAATTFYAKYGGLPGDLLSKRAAKHGFTTRTGGPGRGDGNELIEGCNTRHNRIGCEIALFWVDLTDAGLIDKSFTVGTGANDGVVDGNSTSGSIASVEDVARFVPTTPLRESAFVVVYPQEGQNYFYIGNLRTAGSAGWLRTYGYAVAHQHNGLAGLTPAEAERLDQKADDGVPSTGIIRAAGAFTTELGITVDPGVSGFVTDECVEEGADPTIQGDEVYNTQDRGFANERSCNIFWRSSF